MRMFTRFEFRFDRLHCKIDCRGKNRADRWIGSQDRPKGQALAEEMLLSIIDTVTSL